MENGRQPSKEAGRTTPGSEIWRSVPKRSDGRIRYRFRTLGGALLCMGGHPVEGRAVRPYNLALLACLAASPGRTASRDKLIAFLWPDRNTSRARHRLSVALHVLRRELGTDVLIPTGDSLTLVRDRTWSDLDAFREAIQEGRLEDAVALHQGPFMDGFHLSGARTFERWIEDERASIERLYRASLKSLIREAEEARRLPDAIHWYEELVASEPFCSRITMAFMEALARMGHLERAVARARAYATLVEAKLGIPPDPDVLALARELLGERRRSEPLRRNIPRTT